jgi:hypothetical protein
MNPRLPFDFLNEFSEVAQTRQVEIKSGGIQSQRNVGHLPFSTADLETGNHRQNFDPAGLRQRHNL